MFPCVCVALSAAVVAQFNADAWFGHDPVRRCGIVAEFLPQFATRMRR
jgi:hypothetical protein